MSGNVIGQAVFIRTDTPDYAEEAIPFKTLEEMAAICSQAHPNLTLEKIVVYSMSEGAPCALTLSFISSARTQQPSDLQLANH
jgi:hypothetical protein